MRQRAYENLRSRRNPEELVKEAFAKIQEDEPVRYLLGSMEEVDNVYTQNTFREGERVLRQIVQGLENVNLSAEFEYQGSVTKNTHIKAHSDIDLLVIEKRFYSLEPPHRPLYPYFGVPIDDLMQIRSVCVSRLRANFPRAIIDDSGPRSIKISGGSLKRTVDIVPANWYNTSQYVSTGNKTYRGIHILNSHSKLREEDVPFRHGELIGIKDKSTKGNTKKLIRLLKSLKYDSEGVVKISSFDIEALVYAMDNNDLQKNRGEEIPQATICWRWMKNLENDATLRNSLMVPDGKRKIFCSGKATLSQLTALRTELESLLYEINQGLANSARKLSEAKVNWPSRVDWLANM